MAVDNTVALATSFDQLLKSEENNVVPSVDSMIDAVKALEANSSKESVRQTLIDLIWLYDVKYEIGIHATGKNGQSKEANRILLLLRTLLKSGYLDVNSLTERLEPELLEALYLVSSAVILNKKMIRVNTALLYKQQKFNLLWEENEGYSKLLLEILSAADSLSANRNFEPSHILLCSEQLVKRIQSTIGYFDLDPNRVLDLMIDCFAQKVESSYFFVQLFSCYVEPQRRPALSQIVGFKFGAYTATSTPRSFYVAVAFLLEAGLVILSSLFPYLSPSDDNLLLACKSYLKEASTSSKKGGHALDALGSLVTMEDLESNDAKVSVVDPVESTHENAPASSSVGYLQRYQKLGLLEALFHVRDEANAMTLYATLPNSPVFLLGCDSLMSISLCQMIRFMLRPLYNTVITKRSLQTTQPSTRQSLSKTCRTVSSFEELYTVIFPLLRQLGPYLSYDPTLFTQLCQLGRHCVKRAKCSPPWMALTQFSLLPALSLLTANASCAMTFWQFFKHTPFEQRYAFYADWRSLFIPAKATTKYPELFALSVDVLKESRRLLRRLSKDTVAVLSRRLGKLSHATPLLVFEVILEQITSYDNLIPVVVDALRYVNHLSFDVLSYCLIQSLQREGTRVKEDGSSLAQWLNSLAQFAGSLYRKYTMDLNPLLIFIAQRLERKETYDLILLQNLLEKMGGMEKQEDLSEEQLILAGTGGPSLKRLQASASLSMTHIVGAKPHILHTKKSAKRLWDALQETQLTSSLALLIAQQSRLSLFEKELHVKLATRLYDSSQETLLMYLTFMAEQEETEEHPEQEMKENTTRSPWPSFEQLVLDHHIEPDMAFLVCRPLINKAVSYDTSSLIDAIPRCLPEMTWSGLSPTLYVTFWEMRVDDLSLCTATYERTLEKWQSLAKEEEKETDSTSASRHRDPTARSVLEELTREYESRKQQISTHRQQMRIASTTWFSPATQRSELVSDLMQYCLFPRSVQSTLDAIFCAQFILLMHSLGLEEVSTLRLYDRIANDVGVVLYASTCNEILHYGRFLQECLVTWHRWHTSALFYEQEAQGQKKGNEEESTMLLLSGFARKWNAPVHSVDDTLSYEEFRHALYKWHSKISRALVNALESKAYMPVKNALLLLTKVADVFPAVEKIGKSLEKRIKALCQPGDEEREDLRILATRVLAMVQSRKASWIVEDFFHTTEKTAELLLKRQQKEAEEEAEEAKKKKKAAEALAEEQEKAKAAARLQRKKQQQRQEEQTSDAVRRKATSTLKTTTTTSSSASTSVSASTSSTHHRDAKRNDTRRSNESLSYRQSGREETHREQSGHKGAEMRSTSSSFKRPHDQISSSNARTAPPAVETPTSVIRKDMEDRRPAKRLHASNDQRAHVYDRRPQRGGSGYDRRGR